jgi:hypothetical protein
MTYSFSLLRFVPDPARGEFVNIGAIAGDEDGGDWELRLVSNLRRARAIDSSGALPAAMALVTALQERLPEDDQQGAEFTLGELRLLAGELNNILQVTTPGRVVASDATDALDRVCADLLLDPALQPGQRYRNQATARGATKRAYRSAQVPDFALASRVDVHAARSHGVFDFAVHNGEAVQLAKCYSFELPDQQSLARDIAAWAWLSFEVRTHGATFVTSGGTEVEAPRELSIACVYVPPVAGGDVTAFEEASHVFDELKIDAWPAGSADNVAVIASQRLAAHGIVV